MRSIERIALPIIRWWLQAHRCRSVLKGRSEGCVALDGEAHASALTVGLLVETVIDGTRLEWRGGVCDEGYFHIEGHKRAVVEQSAVTRRRYFLLLPLAPRGSVIANLIYSPLDE